MGKHPEGYHSHEDYWEPQTPGRTEELKKIIKRRLRKTTQQSNSNTSHPTSRMATKEASVCDFLQKEINSFDLKQLLKINRDVFRKNHYAHMHLKEAKAAEPE